MLVNPGDTLTRPPSIINDKIAIARWNCSFTLQTGLVGTACLNICPGMFTSLSGTALGGFGVTSGSVDPATGSCTALSTVAPMPSGLTAIMQKV